MLITVFVVYIPINHSVEDTPNRLFIIIQGVGAVFLGLIAYRVIVDPKGNKEKKNSLVRFSLLFTVLIKSGHYMSRLCLHTDHCSKSVTTEPSCIV